MADLSSGHRRERVGGSEDGLVVHHGLGGHHRHAAHLSHLRMDLGRERKESLVGKRTDTDGPQPCCSHSPFRTQALVVWSWGKPREPEPVGGQGQSSEHARGSVWPSAGFAESAAAFQILRPPTAGGALLTAKRASERGRSRTLQLRQAGDGGPILHDGICWSRRPSVCQFDGCCEMTGASELKRER